MLQYHMLIFHDTNKQQDNKYTFIYSVVMEN